MQCLEGCFSGVLRLLEKYKLTCANFSDVLLTFHAKILWKSKSPKNAIKTFPKTSKMIFSGKQGVLESDTCIYCSVFVVLVCKVRLGRDMLSLNNQDSKSIIHSFFEKEKFMTSFTTSLFYWKEVTFYYDLMIFNSKTILTAFEEKSSQTKTPGLPGSKALKISWNGKLFSIYLDWIFQLNLA